jgi:outer membrane murein-binding lipoprotein Lpp
MVNAYTTLGQIYSILVMFNIANAPLVDAPPAPPAKKRVYTAAQADELTAPLHVLEDRTQWNEIPAGSTVRYVRNGEFVRGGILVRHTETAAGERAFKLEAEAGHAQWTVVLSVVQKLWCSWDGGAGPDAVRHDEYKAAINGLNAAVRRLEAMVEAMAKKLAAAGIA